MATVIDARVGDRMIEGKGTSSEQWREQGAINTLKCLSPDRLFPEGSRICIIAPHPDDEIAGCAGLIQRLDQADFETTLFAVTNGTASHPHSTRYSPELLNQIRPQETLDALTQLDLKHQVPRIELGLQDGEVDRSEQLLIERLLPHISARDILISTFAKDGHPDHESTGRAVQQLAELCSVMHLQVLIWAWHWAKPLDQRIPWQNSYRLDLTAEELHKKQLAMSLFKSQIEADPTTGKAAILPEHVLQRILLPWEVYIHA